MGLLDSRGKLIGVNTAILSASGASAGIGFAIPVDTVRRIVTQLIRYGRVTKPSLGIQVADDQITQGISQPLRVDIQGVMVVEVGPRSSASQPLRGAPLRGMARRANGSMSLGDVVTKVYKTPIRNVEDLLCAIEELEIGGVAQLTVRRQGTGPGGANIRTSRRAASLQPLS